MEKVKVDFLINYLESLHPDARCELNYKNDYELLIAIMLSAQTTDRAVNEVTKNLFDKYPDIYSLSNAEHKDVESIIKQIGLYKNKTSNIINTAKKLVLDGYLNIPSQEDYLLTLPGVGRKTANVFLSEYYDLNTLGVDTHISRVSIRLNLSKDDDSIVEIENKLKKYFKDYSYKLVHHLLIFFGRYDCKAKKPNCDNCILKKYCNYYKNQC